MLNGGGSGVGERGASDGVGGEGVLRAHGAEFLAVVAAEEAVQHEQQRFPDWWEEGADEWLLGWALHASEVREAWLQYQVLGHCPRHWNWVRHW